MIHAVGVGPGDPELLTIRTRRLIEEAETLAGFATVLKVVDAIGRAERVVLTYANQTEMLDQVALRHRQGSRCVVCFMGDPSFSGRQLLDRVVAAIGEPVEVTPGISSVQLAAARAGLGFEDVVFVTFHRRGEIEPDLAFLAEALKLGRGAIVLPRPSDLMPAHIARELVRRGVSGQRTVAVYERLSGDERSWEGRLGDLDASFSDLSILVVRP